MSHADETGRIKSLFLGALEREGGERRNFLDEGCGDDADLRRRVEALLEANEGASDFLAEPEGPGPNGSPARHAGSEAPGHSIGRYKLLQQIGEGGFGTVWMAEQLEPVRRKVALKVIKLGMDTKQVVARFEAERQALALMDHPNIAKVLDGGVTEGGRPFFVMELVRGVPITEYCDEARLSTEQRLELFVQVCHAVQHAHQKGIIHRDLKPSNVMVTLHDGRPVPMVIDFGIAKATSGSLTEKTLFTEFRQFLGTPEYMSPEQAEISGLDVDTRADIYSLGVLLYELLTGTTPLDPRSLRSAAYDEILRLIREVDPDRPSTRVSTLGEGRIPVATARSTEPGVLQRLMRGDLDWIVMKALEKERTRRYGSAAGFAEDIERFLSHEPVAARPPSRAYKLAKFARRNRVVVGAGLVVLLTLCGGAVTTTIGFVRAERGRLEALAAERRAQGLAEEARLAELRAEEQAAEARAAERLAREAAQRERAARAEEAAQRERAAEEAGAAVAINAFYDDMLFSIDPLRLRTRSGFALGDETPATAETLDRDVSVVEMLRGAAESIDESFRGKPELAAKVRETVGVTLLGLGRGDDAFAQLGLAMDLLEARRDAPEEDLVRLRLLRGGAAATAGDVELAEELTRSAWQDSKRLFGARHPRALFAASLLGEVLSSRGKYAEAEGILEETLAVQREQLGDDHRDTIHTLNALLGCFLWKTDPLQAEPYALEAYERATRTLAPDDIVRVEAEALLGILLQFQLEHERAEELLRASHAKKLRLLGEDHPSTADTQYHLARCLNDEAQVEERERLLRQAFATLSRTRPGSPALSILQRDLALTLWGRGEDAEALELLRAYAEDILAVGGLGDPRAPEALRLLRSALERNGHAEEAELVYRRYIAAVDARGGRESGWTCSAFWALCRFYQRIGDEDGAREAWQGCLDVRREMADRPGNPGGKRFYADMLLRPSLPGAEDPEQAIVYLERALEEGMAVRDQVAAWDDIALAYRLLDRGELAADAESLAWETSAAAARSGGVADMVQHARRFLDEAVMPTDTDEALRWVRRALERAPGDEQALWLLCALSLERGEREAALEAQGRLVERHAASFRAGETDPNSYLWSLVAWDFDELHTPELVRSLAEQLQEWELNAQLWNTLGVARYRLEEFAAATEALEEADRQNAAVGFGYNPALDRFFLAACHHLEGRPERARELYERAVRDLEEDEDLSFDDRVLRESMRREAERVLGAPVE